MKLSKGVKISIIGAGLVGSSAAFSIMSSGLASDLVLVDINRAKAEGEAMDLGDAAAFIKPTNVYAGSFEDCQDSNIVVFTAGANQKPGETRLDLVHKNVNILKENLEQLLKYCPQAIYLIVANPVDVLTYVALKISGLPSNQIFGSGTVLDTSRFRAEVADYCNVDPRNVHAYIVGEHGDSEVAIWSTADVAGIPLEQFSKMRGLKPICKNEIAKRVRTAAYEIIQRKGATYYAIAVSIKRICETILRDENSILTVSGMVNGVYGIQDCCLSLPSIVNGSGREKVLTISMMEEEAVALRDSAQILKGVIKQAGY